MRWALRRLPPAFSSLHCKPERHNRPCPIKCQHGCTGGRNINNLAAMRRTTSSSLDRNLALVMGTSSSCPVTNLADEQGEHCHADHSACDLGATYFVRCLLGRQHFRTGPNRSDDRRSIVSSTNGRCGRGGHHRWRAVASHASVRFWHYGTDHSARRTRCGPCGGRASRIVRSGFAPTSKSRREGCAIADSDGAWPAHRCWASGADRHLHGRCPICLKG